MTSVVQQTVIRIVDAVKDMVLRFKFKFWSVIKTIYLISSVMLGAAISAFLTCSLYISSQRVRRIAYAWKVFWPGFFEYKINEYKVNHRYYTTENEENESWEKLHKKYAPRLLKAILKLEGVFYKVGQVYGSRKDFVPETFFKYLNTLVDSVPPKPIRIMRPKMENDFGSNLEEIFEEFVEDALAAASIGQVHKARLRDGEIRDVVVKTTYPNSEKLTRADMVSFILMAKLSTPEQVQFMQEFSNQLMLEFDFTREAKMQKLISESLKEEFPDIVIPRVVDHLVTRGSMVMEFVEGTPLMGAIYTLEFSQSQHLLKRMVQVCGKIALIDGRFHSDPHPGNWFVRKDGKIVMLDFGQVKEISQKTRQELADLVLLLKSDASDNQLAAMMRKLGFKTQKDNDQTYAFFARFAFDSNPIPNLMLAWVEIMQGDPMTNSPAEFAMLSRLGIMLRGVISLFPHGADLRISSVWEPYAKRALQEPILNS